MNGDGYLSVVQAGVSDRSADLVCRDVEHGEERGRVHPPLEMLLEREAVLLSCRYVDEVVMNVGGKDSRISIDLVQPDYILIGSDWAKKDYYAQMGFDQDWLDERGIGLIYVPYTKEISSTNIKGRM